MTIARSLFAASLAAASLLTPALSAQQRIIQFPDEDRVQCNVLIFDQATRSVPLFVSLGYTAPLWKAEYDKPGVLDQYKGKNVRLGKNWWTKLDTITPLEIAGTKLAPGSYCLGLHYAQDGSFHLLALDASSAIKHGMIPNDADSWKGGTRIPLKLEKGVLDATRERMLIEISMDEKDPSKGMFKIEWGTHRASAAVKYLEPMTAKDAAHDK